MSSQGNSVGAKITVDILQFAYIWEDILIKIGLRDQTLWKWIFLWYEEDQINRYLFFFIPKTREINW